MEGIWENSGRELENSEREIGRKSERERERIVKGVRNSERGNDSREPKRALWVPQTATTIPREHPQREEKNVLCGKRWKKCERIVVGQSAQLPHSRKRTVYFSPNQPEPMSRATLKCVL